MKAMLENIRMEWTRVGNSIVDALKCETYRCLNQIDHVMMQSDSEYSVFSLYQWIDYLSQTHAL
jgi:hypothetical protein